MNRFFRNSLFNCGLIHGRVLTYSRMSFPILVLEIGAIIGIAAGSAVGAVFLFLLFNFTIFVSWRYKHLVGELDTRFQYLHALLLGQDGQYIKRVEIISMTNLLYVDKQIAFTKRYKEIRDRGDSSAQTVVNNLKDLLAERNFKALKAALPEARQLIDNYDEEVNALNNDLVSLIRPEEECRQAVLSLKERLRAVRQDYYVKQADLTLVADSFEIVFAKIDKGFKKFETFVESAQYEDANALLPQLEAVIVEMERDLAELPNLCVTISSIIPDKLSSLKNRYDEMIAAEYPLQHLFINRSIDEMEQELQNCSNQVRNFHLKGVSENLDAILSRIDIYFEEFDKEIEARTIFERECENVYALNGTVEKKYIRLVNALPKVKKVYILPDEGQKKADQISNMVNQMGASKRSLDTFIHAGAKQAYTALEDKMKLLKNETNEASEAIDDFQRYLTSLRDNANSSLAIIKDYQSRIHGLESQLRHLDVQAAMEKYAERINGCYDLINQTHELIYNPPIDVSAVEQRVAELQEKGDALIAEITSDIESANFASSAILYANRDRQHLGEVHETLNQAETAYFSGEFAQSYALAEACLKRIRGN